VPICTLRRRTFKKFRLEQSSQRLGSQSDYVLVTRKETHAPSALLGWVSHFTLGCQSCQIKEFATLDDSVRPPLTSFRNLFVYSALLFA